MGCDELALLPSAPLEVFGKIGAVLQVIAHNQKDVGQPKARGLLNDLLGCIAALECANNKIQRDAAAAHPVHAVRVERQGNCFDQFLSHDLSALSTKLAGQPALKSRRLQSGFVGCSHRHAQALSSSGQSQSFASADSAPSRARHESASEASSPLFSSPDSRVFMMSLSIAA